MSTAGQLDLPRSTVLRVELKEWERAFVAANCGRKPGRDDIKRDAAIAAKYKEYNTLQRASVKPRPPETPRKRLRTIEGPKRALGELQANRGSITPKRTPSTAKHGSVPLAAFSPQQEAIPTPAFIRCALGPTPQKDGHVLGIFDMPFSSTPSRTGNVPPSNEDVAIRDTPRTAAQAASQPGHSRTPQSTGKRFFLDAFAGTPLKRKRDDETGTPSTARRKFATPTFLRRGLPFASIAEEPEDDVPMPPPFKKRGLVRSLSSIIQGLRKQEQQRMDDDWDILQELEREERGDAEEKRDAPTLAVEDRQPGEMPLGPDQAAVSVEDAPVNQGQDVARKPWKKKGLKRQTRRVIMKPVLHRPKKAEDGSEDESDPDVVLETQLDATASKGATNDHDDDDEFNASDHDQEDKSPTKTKSTSKTSKPLDSSTKEDKKKPRKVSAQAHANFRKLKIKNKNSKAGGRGGRFGRR